jgi:alpha-tubulin suppressor-like RCC1 family protein
MMCSRTTASGAIVLCGVVACADDLPRVVALEVGQDNSCAVFDDGGVKCWGWARWTGYPGLDPDDRLGDDETPGELGYVELGGAVSEVVAGRCALMRTGEARCFGRTWDQTAGMLGLPGVSSVGSERAPAEYPPVSLGEPVVQLAPGSRHACALLESGAVRCWGENGEGQVGVPGYDAVGDDEHPSEVPPVRVVDDGRQIVSITAGGDVTCALLEDAAVRCWGRGAEYLLGTGTKLAVGDDEDPSSIADVRVGAPVRRVAVSYEHACVLTVKGGVRCWGSNYSAELGYTQDLGPEPRVGDNEAPGAYGDVAVGETVEQVGVGQAATCVRTESGRVLCWGGASVVPGPNRSPTEVDLGGRATDLSVGGGFAHACARLEDDTYRCWGWNEYGQLGYGRGTETIGDDETPAQAGPVPL